MKQITIWATWIVIQGAAMLPIMGGFAQADPGGPGNGRSQSVLDVNGSGNGTDNRITIDPKTGQKVVVNGSANGVGNTLTVAPDPHGEVIIRASANGTGNKIVVDEAPGEKVKIIGSANGKDNNVIIDKVPGPTAKRPRAEAYAGYSKPSGHQPRRK